jgi:glycosyltransferase involved in cell wall biosynthesis
MHAPLVSIAITSYNTERWVGRAIASALEQETSFPVEIVVSDDCSQDNTREVVKGFVERYPNTVRLIAQPKNVGMQRNYFDTFQACKGKYIAWLDADDYWTDSHKLSLQTDALEADDTLMVCGHFVRWVSTSGEVQRDRYPNIQPGRYGLDEVLRHNILPSPSAVFRNGIQRDLPEWYFDLAPLTDWPIWVLAALRGEILMLDATLADYMLTPGSHFMSKGEIAWYKTDARFYEHIGSVLPENWQRLVRLQKGRRYETLADALREMGDFAGSREAAFKALCAPALMDNVGSKMRVLAAAMFRSAEAKLRS